MQQTQTDYKTAHKDYLKYVEKISPRQSTLLSLLKAFMAGGIICCVGQASSDIIKAAFPALSAETISTYGMVTVVFITILLTAFGVFDKVAVFGGAGTFLPISGFANSIASSAIEFKTEGFIFGLSSKFFSIAGPVIVNGISWAFAAGLVRWIISLVTGGKI